MKRRTFLKGAAAAAAVTAFPSKGDAMSLVGFEEWLYMVNPCSGEFYRMFLKEEAPIRASEEISSRETCVLNHTTQCGVKDVIGLFGVSIQAPPNIRIRMTIDGEDILADHPEIRSGSWESKPILTSLFLAYTREHTMAGLFLPNATNIQMWVDKFNLATTPIRVGVELRTAVYWIKSMTDQEIKEKRRVIEEIYKKHGFHVEWHGSGPSDYVVEVNALLNSERDRSFIVAQEEIRRSVPEIFGETADWLSGIKEVEAHENYRKKSH